MSGVSFKVCVLFSLFSYSLPRRGSRNKTLEVRIAQDHHAYYFQNIRVVFYFVLCVLLVGKLIFFFGEL